MLCMGGGIGADGIVGPLCWLVLPLKRKIGCSSVPSFLSLFMGTVLTLMLESEEIGVRALMKQLLKGFYSHKLRSYGKAR